MYAFASVTTKCLRSMQSIVQRIIREADLFVMFPVNLMEKYINVLIYRPKIDHTVLLLYNT